MLGAQFAGACRQSYAKPPDDDHRGGGESLTANMRHPSGMHDFRGSTHSSAAREEAVEVRTESNIYRAAATNVGACLDHTAHVIIIGLFSSSQWAH